MDARTHERTTEPMHGFGNYVDMNYVTLRKISRQKFIFLMQLNTNRLNHKLLDFANCLHSEWELERREISTALQPINMDQNASARHKHTHTPQNIINLNVLLQFINYLSFQRAKRSGQREKLR